MIKKISALVLALVLCLSVVVVPVSAAELTLGDASIAFALEWDKDSYSAGDTAYLSVYMDAKDDIALYTGAITIGLNSAVFTQADNPIADVAAGVTYDETFASYYVTTAAQWSWLNSTIAKNVTAKNTAEEQALYDHYIKYTAGKNIEGSHPNASNDKDGFYGTDLDPSKPILVIPLKVSATVANDTVVRAAITSGSITYAAKPTQWKYYKTPGTASTSAPLTANTTTIGITKADTTVANGGTDVTIGAASIISPLSTQIRFNGPENGDTKAPFDVRTRATVSKADFAELLGVTDLAQFEATAKGKGTALRVGFVYMADSADGDYDEAAAKAAAIAGEDAPGYKVVDVSYIQRSGDNYVWTCFIAGPDYTDGVNALAYIICDGCEPQFKTVDATTFSELYDAAKAAGIIPKA